MQMIADILLAAGALGAAVYCIVLAGRLKRFNNLQDGMGGAVAVLSAQVDDMTRTLQNAQMAAATSSASLTALTERAEDVARRLELMLASMHDLPDPAAPAARPASRKPKAPPSPGDPTASPGPNAASEPATPSASASTPDLNATPTPTPVPTPAPTPVPTPEKLTPVFLSNRENTLEAAQ